LANINEQTSSFVDFLTKLNSFMSSNGWTSERFNTGAGEWAMRRVGSGYEIRFAAQWDTATPDNLGLYHYVGQNYDTGSAPYDQDNDSGNGAQSTSNTALDDARFVDIGATPVQYWAFEDDHYTYVVVETSTGVFKHFGFGQLNKGGADYVGGSFVYGHGFVGGLTSISTAWRSGNTFFGPFDGLLANPNAFGTVNALYGTTLYAEGLPNQPASGKFGVCVSQTDARGLGQDRQSTPRDRFRILWGSRNGPVSANFQPRFSGQDIAGNAALSPIVVAYFESSTVIRPLGIVPDVFEINVDRYTPGQIITISSDTYRVFPKQQLGVAANQTANAGFAYLVVA
jgi:hypothetical protein